jgi:hypothetical protein
MWNAKFVFELSALGGGKKLVGMPSCRSSTMPHVSSRPRFGSAYDRSERTSEVPGSEAENVRGNGASTIVVVVDDHSDDRDPSVWVVERLVRDRKELLIIEVVFWFQILRCELRVDYTRIVNQA